MAGLILFFIFLSIIFGLMKIIEIMTDISESLRLLANNPKTIEEVRKIRLQSSKMKKTVE